MKLSEMSRKDLTKIHRLKVNSLITVEIHARDVIDKMYKVGKYSKNTSLFVYFKVLTILIYFMYCNKRT